MNFIFDLKNKMSAQPQRGFTVLFAVLLSSILLVIGLAVFNISLKELILSSSARDSVFAFYAADSGTECTLYWDLSKGVFPTTTAAQAPTTGQIICNEQDMVQSTSWDYERGSDYIKATFQIDYPETKIDDSSDSYACAIVSIKKWVSGDTVIESKGYNTCQLGHPRRIERALRVLYTR